MAVIIMALVSGLVFGSGLTISGMSEPAKVLGFLDIFGTWDPTLAVVMVAALIIVIPGYVLARRHGRPILAQENLWPAKTAIDPPLVIGAMMFGIGWGLVGLCPGPAITDLSTASPRVIIFVIAMALGMVLQNIWRKGHQLLLPHPA
jgi:uncharacterized membrane protein YedE/YeeE